MSCLCGWKGGLLLLVAGLLLAVEWLQSVQAQASLPRVYPHIDYPVDTLQRLVRNPRVPDTSRVFFLARLAQSIGSTDLTKAAKYANEANQLAQHLGYVRGQLQSLWVLGSTKMEMGDYVAAIKVYQQAVVLSESTGHKRMLVPLYRNLGNISLVTGDPVRGLNFLLESYRVLRGLCPEITPECVEDYSLCYTSLGTAYFEQKRYHDAKVYALMALMLYDRYSTAPGAAKANLLLGRIYQAELPHTPARLDSAGFYLQAALYIQATKENEKEVAGNLISLAELYQQQRKYRDMYQVALRSLKMARKVGSIPFEQDAASLVARASAALGNYQEAYGYQLQAETLNARMVDEEKARAQEQLQVRYEVQAQQQRIGLLTQQTESDAAAARQQRRWQWMLVCLCSTLTLFLIVGTVLFVRLRKSRRELAYANEELACANEEISQSMAEKEVLVQEIQHRVINNLTLMGSLLSWQRDTMPDPALAKILDGNRARLQSMAMVHKFLYQADNLASVRLDNYLQALLDSQHSALARPGITLKTNLAPVLMDAKEAGYFGLIVNEVVTNAYKHAFVNDKGCLIVELVHQGDGFFLGITDDGKGLPETGYVSRPNSIGIQLVKTLTKQLKAKISVQPQPVGTRVEITRLF